MTVPRDVIEYIEEREAIAEGTTIVNTIADDFELTSEEIRELHEQEQRTTEQVRATSEALRNASVRLRGRPVAAADQIASLWRNVRLDERGAAPVEGHRQVDPTPEKLSNLGGPQYNRLRFTSSLED